jgi:glucosamine 6-phosphate synthetase-like amidotransferase/phosphosugar isomerase protein
VEENFLASDVTALLSYTLTKVLYIMDGETVSLTPKGVTIHDHEGRW